MNEILIGKIASAVQLQGSLSGEEQLSGTFHLYGIPQNPYYGVYSVTPTNGTQILQTNGKTLINNITVDPIPSNYGLITYDGTIITVS